MNITEKNHELLIHYLEKANSSLFPYFLSFLSSSLSPRSASRPFDDVDDARHTCGYFETVTYRYCVFPAVACAELAGVTNPRIR